MPSRAVLMVVVFLTMRLAAPAQASGQAVFLGAGGTYPVGDFGDYADMGWVVNGGVELPLPLQGLSASVFAEGVYGSNSHSDIEGDKTNLLGALGGVGIMIVALGPAEVSVFGQAGFLRHQYKSREFPQFDESVDGIALGGGAKLAFSLGALRGWVAGRVLQGRSDEANGATGLLAGMAGVSIPLVGLGG